MKRVEVWYRKVIFEWKEKSGRKYEILSAGVCAASKMIMDEFKEVSQLVKHVDYNESLGFTSHGQNVGLLP